MAQSFTYTVTSTPVLLVRASNADDGVQVTVSNGSGDDVYLGATNTVAVNQGVLVHKNVSATIASRQQFTLYAGDELWAVTTTTSVVNVYVSGGVR